MDIAIDLIILCADKIAAVWERFKNYAAALQGARPVENEETKVWALDELRKKGEEKKQKKVKTWLLFVSKSKKLTVQFVGLDAKGRYVLGFCRRVQLDGAPEEWRNVGCPEVFELKVTE